MATVCCCSYHGCHCCRWWWSEASSSSCWLSTPLEGYEAFTQGHGVADSGPNSGTSDALRHSGTGVVGVGGVEEVLVVVVVVVVVVVRSRYH